MKDWFDFLVFEFKGGLLDLPDFSTDFEFHKDFFNNKLLRFAEDLFTDDFHTYDFQELLFDLRLYSIDFWVIP